MKTPRPVKYVKRLNKNNHLHTYRRSLTAEETVLWMLANKVEVLRSLETPCWEWQGDKNWKGYGRAAFNHRRWAAHRLFFVLTVNPSLPESELVCHRCDNRICFNPEHMFIGTHLDNRRDCVNKNRREHCYTRKLKEAQVREIRKLRPHRGRKQKDEPSTVSLAVRYKVSVGCIEKVVGWQSWRNLANNA